MPVLKKVLRNVLRESLAKATPAPVYAPDLDLKFAEELRLDPRVDFSRGSNATVVDSDGTLKWAGHNLVTYSEFDAAIPTNWSIGFGTGTFTHTLGSELFNLPTITHEQTVSGRSYLSQTLNLEANTNYRFVVYVDEELSFFTSGNQSYFYILGFSDSSFPSGIPKTLSDVVDGKMTIDFDTGSDTSGEVRIGVGGGLNSVGKLVFAAPHIYKIDKEMQERTDVATGLETYYPTTSAAYYAPRFDHDPATNESLGLLIEEARTNLFNYSEQFDNSAWTKSNSLITANVASAPDGTLTGDKLVENTATSNHIIQDNSVSISVSTQYAMSVFAKSAGDSRTLAFLGMGLGSSFPIFNLDTGTTEGSAADWDSVGMYPVGNGWYHCWAVGTATGTLSPIIALYNESYTYTGDGTSGVFIFGAQVEEGSFPTSYIPTSGSSVTRSADVADIQTSDFNFSATEGTLFTEAQTFVHNNSHRVLSISDGTTSNRIIMQAHTTNHLFVGSGGATQAALDAGRYYSNQYSKHSAAYQENNFAACLDGGTVATDSLGTIPTVNIMNIGAGATGNFSFLNGHIKQLTYFARRLDDATLQALTQPSLEPSLNLVFDSSETSYVNTGLTR